MSEVVAALEFALTLQERRDYSMAEEYIFKGGEAYDNQEIVDSPRNVKDCSNHDKKIVPAFDFGMKLTKKMRLFFSIKPRPISRNNAGYYATEAAPNDKQAVNIEPVLVPPVHLNELKEITDNFGTQALICQGSCGKLLYIGILKSGQPSCIKKLDFNKLPIQEFLAQVSMASMIEHENVVKLLSYCVDGGLRIFAYEYAPNGSLHDILHGRQGTKGAQPGPALSWSQRVKIAVGAAKGLEYLREKYSNPNIHCNITSSNVLLFDDNVAKIADFSWSNRINEMAERLYSTCVLGTFSYHAPE